MPTNILYPFLFSPIRATCPTHLIHFDFVTLIIKSYIKNRRYATIYIILKQYLLFHMFRPYLAIISCV
jgi:hypothetical protein